MFARQEDTDMGLYESVRSGGFPGFTIGVTTACFHASGIYPVRNM